MQLDSATGHMKSQIAQWATAYLEYEIPILVKSDDLWSHKTTYKH